MYRACELKDQTYKKTRTLHFSEKGLLPSTLKTLNPLIKEIKVGLLN